MVTHWQVGAGPSLWPHHSVDIEQVIRRELQPLPPHQGIHRKYYPHEIYVHMHKGQAAPCHDFLQQRTNQEAEPGLMDNKYGLGCDPQLPT